MHTRHIKSSCCREIVRRYGERRQQCTGCLRTWRKSPHKRGRKPKRRRYNLIRQMVLRNQSAEDQRNHFPRLTVYAIQKRAQRALQTFVARPRHYPRLRGSYILIADGIWYSFDDKDYILYTFLLKPKRRNYAYLLDPITLKGKEKYDNWKAAIDSIPGDVRKRVYAFVSDAFRASGRIVHTFEWIHQLCHFHFLSELQKRRGRRKMTLKSRFIREDIYQNVCQIMRSKDRRVVHRAVERLQWIVRHRACPDKLRMMTNEFLRTRSLYRTYLTHPSLTIPRTTSAAESLNKQIRKRTRVLKTPEAVQQWSTAFVRLRGTIVCNSYQHWKNQPN